MSPTAKPKSETYAAEHAALMRFQGLRRRILALAIFCLAGLLLIVSSAWANEQVHDFIEAFGAGFIGLAVVGRLWCTLYIGGKKGGQIVRSGPYSVMRNPLYFFSSIGAVGIGAQSGSLSIALLVGTLCIAAFSIVIRREERFLAGQFGDSYADYLVSVPRFFPNLRLFRDEETLVIIPKRIYATLLDGLVFFAAFPAFEAVEYLQEIGILPVLLRLY